MQIGLGDHCEVPSASGVAPASKVKMQAAAKSSFKENVNKISKKKVKKRAPVESTSEEDSPYYSESEKTLEISFLAQRSKNLLDVSSSSFFASASLARTSTPVPQENVFHPATHMPSMDKSKSILLVLIVD